MCIISDHKNSFELGHQSRDSEKQLGFHFQQIFILELIDLTTFDTQSLITSVQHLICYHLKKLFLQKTVLLTNEQKWISSFTGLRAKMNVGALPPWTTCRTISRLTRNHTSHAFHYVRLWQARSWAWLIEHWFWYCCCWITDRKPCHHTLKVPPEVSGAARGFFELVSLWGKFAIPNDAENFRGF